MKKKYIVAALALWGVATGAMAQKKDFSYKLYGQIRTDLFYDTRNSYETVDGLFYMYPNDVALDADGKDLNDRGHGNFYAIYSRLGLDVKGPKIFKNVKTSAKIEADFRGSGSTLATVRLRHAYFNLNFGHSDLLLGQTWHPMYGNVAPSIMNLNMGAPYQPFGRAPQIRYQYKATHFLLTASALWQSQYKSMGPKSNKPGETAGVKSQDFIKNSCIPEFYLGADYRDSGLILGAGLHVSSLSPRTQSEKDGNVYKVDERITSLSGEAHVKYTTDKLYLAAKTLLTSNMTMTSCVGGYGVTATDSRTGEQEYTPLRMSHSWISVMYGKKLKAGVFGGYLKNLGAKDEVSSLIGTGTNIDQLTTATAELTYNLPNWKFGAEYSWCGAWYGDNDKKGKVENTHLVKNNRFVVSALFMF